MSGENCLLLCFIVLAMPLAIPAEDAGSLHRIQLDDPGELREVFSYTGTRLPIVSAHRGGPVTGFPENCIETFENTLKHTFSILEIDLQYTRDGHIVLHHDEALDRTTTGTGPLKEKTLAELKQLHLVDREGAVTDYRIPTLDDAITWARGKAILILDRKRTVTVETCVEVIQKHRSQAFVMIMAYSMDDVKTVHQLDPDIMMEVFMGTRERFEQFESSGVPWNRIVAFISHQPPDDLDLVQSIHDLGTSTMAGTSRYLDRELKAAGTPSPELAERYHQLLRDGIDFIETDLPGAVAGILFSDNCIPDEWSAFLKHPSADQRKAGP